MPAALSDNHQLGLHRFAESGASLRDDTRTHLLLQNEGNLRTKSFLRLSDWNTLRQREKGTVSETRTCGTKPLQKETVLV